MPSSGEQRAVLKIRRAGAFMRKSLFLDLCRRNNLLRFLGAKRSILDEFEYAASGAEDSGGRN